MSMVILLGLAIHRGTTLMVTMVIILNGTSRITTILIGGPIVDIVHILVVAGGTKMAAAIAWETITIVVIVVVNMMKKNSPVVRIVSSVETTVRQSGATSRLHHPVMPATRVWSSGVEETPRSVKAVWDPPNRLGRNPSVPGLQLQAQYRDRRQRHQ